MLDSIIQKITGRFTPLRVTQLSRADSNHTPDVAQPAQPSAPAPEMEVPPGLGDVHEKIGKSVALSREMVDNMMAVAAKAQGLSLSHSERLLELSECDSEGVADAQALAQALVYSQSPLKELHISLQKQSANRNSATKASVLVIHAALAEQQYADSRLREGTCFSAEKLYSTLMDWVYKGAHRPGREDAPLTQIAKTIDLTSKSANHACEMRFGCVIPVLVSTQILEGLQQQKQREADHSHDTDQVVTNEACQG